jgi:hypothetical protein
VKASSSEVWLVTRFEGRGVCKIFLTEDFELRRGISVFFILIKKLDGSRTFSNVRWKEEAQGELNEYYGRKEQAVCLPGSSERYGKKTRRKGELMIEIKKKGHDCGRGGNILYFGDDEVLEIEEAKMGGP